MIINNITTCGFQRVHQGYFEASVAGYPGFGPKILDFLAHCMVSITVSDVTSIEMMYLKEFSSEIHVIESHTDNFIKDISDTVGNLLKLSDIISSDDDIKHNHSELNILPIGCLNYSAVIVFKGAAVSAITGLMLSELFRSETGKIMSEYPGDDHMANIIADLFPNKFYEYMRSKVSIIDLTTEYMVNKKFYQYTEEPIELAYINTINGEIVFFGADKKQLDSQIKYQKKSAEKTPCVCEKSIVMDFVLNTSFKTFLDILFNTKSIIDYETLNIVMNKEQISIEEDITAKYGQRILELANVISEYKNDLIKSSNESNQLNFNVFNYIFAGTKIKYSVQIPLSDVTSFIESISDKSGESDEIINIKNSLEKYSAIVRSLTVF